MRKLVAAFVSLASFVSAGLALRSDDCEESKELYREGTKLADSGERGEAFKKARSLIGLISD